MIGKIATVEGSFVVVVPKEIAEELGGAGAQVNVSRVNGHVELAALAADDAAFETAVERSFTMHDDLFRKLAK